MKKLLSLLLVLVMVLACFAACGGNDETKAPDETDPPKADDPKETDDPKADDPKETDPPKTDDPKETDPPKTEQVTVPGYDEPATVIVDVLLDFEVADGDSEALKTYIDSVDGVAFAPWKTGNITGGKWVSAGSCFGVNDEGKIFTADIYSVEFDVCFDKFTEKDGFTHVAFITDDDANNKVGNTEPGYSQVYAMVGNADGSFSFNSGSVKPESSVKLEKGKTYTLNFTVDNIEGKFTVTLNGEKVYEASRSFEGGAETMVRFLNGSFTGQASFDNVKLKALMFPE